MEAVAQKMQSIDFPHIPHFENTEGVRCSFVGEKTEGERELTLAGHAKPTAYMRQICQRNPARAHILIMYPQISSSAQEYAAAVAEM